MIVGWVMSEREVGERAIRAPVRRVLSPRKSVLPPLVVARGCSRSARIGPLVWGDARSAMTTQPSSLSTFAMSAGDESEPTVRTAFGIVAYYTTDLMVTI